MSPEILIVIVIIIIIMIYCCNKNQFHYDDKKENFDTYGNHTYSVQRIIDSDDSLDEIELETKYNWNTPIHKIHKAHKIYDHVYDEQVSDILHSPTGDADYVYRGDFDAHDKHIDNKFDTLGSTYSNTGENYLAAYDFNSMKDAPDVYTVYEIHSGDNVFHGEKIHLAQKQY